MDPTIVKELVDYLVHHRLPVGITKKQRYVIKRRASNFTMKDGNLHYVCRRRKNHREHLAKVVLTAKEADRIFVEFHASQYGGHSGGDKTHHAIITRYYWPGMKSDIRKWIAECPDCQSKRAVLKHKKQYNPIEVTEPFELVGMDLVKLTVTKGGNQYICVMVDYFTKWAEAYPLKSKKAEEVTTCLLDFVYKYGVPQRLLTDQGAEFKNKMNKQLCEILGIQRSFSSPYHPQTNGLVEKLNGTIQSSLNKLARNNPKNWDKYLAAAMFGIRTKIHTTTKYSPYFLMFGREARYPSEVPLEYTITNEKVEAIAHKEELHEGLRDQATIYSEVRANVAKRQAKIRKRKEEHGQEDNFEVGDRVLRKNKREQSRKCGKMESEMLGPFIITSLEGKKACIKNSTTSTTANIDHLIHYIEPEERIPAKLKGIQFPSPLCFSDTDPLGNCPPLL